MRKLEFGEMGGLDALIAKLYCDHKDQWVKLTEPRGVQVCTTIQRSGGRNKVKVESTSRTLPGESGTTRRCWIYLKVSDLDEKEISL